MNARTRRRLIAGATAALAALTTPVAGAQEDPYPNKPIRLIVGFTPGSATDVTARIFAQKFNEAWGMPVTVDNLPGAGGSVGLGRGAKSAPDGYTLMYAANGATTIAPSLMKVPYDPLRDLAPITMLLMMPSIIAVNNEVAARNVQDLIALARAQPGKLSYATPGAGTPQHVAGELLKMLAGADIVHVPYRGAIVTDVIGGRVTIAFQNLGSILPIVRDGKLRALAVTSLKRTPILPDLPTVAESGFPGFEAISWFSLIAPAGTPAPIVNKLHQETLKVLAPPELRARFAQMGLDPVGNTPAEFAAIIRSDIDKWAKVIKAAGITAGE